MHNNNNAKKIKSNAELVLLYLYERLNGSSDSKWISYNEIAEAIGISWQLVSYTIKTLENNGYITIIKQGRNQGISISDDIISYIKYM
jgi:DNA-binding transcriptional ArsR family regulator